MKSKIEYINVFADRCGYFYNAYLDKGVKVNNGYNCKHSEQEEFEVLDGKKVGNCFCWSCPFGHEAEEEDFNDPKVDNNGYTYEEGQFIVISEKEAVK